MIQLELKVFVYTEEQEKFIDSGIEFDYNISDADLEDYTFYNINVIKAYDKRYCSILSNGETFVVNESYESVKAKIQQQLTFRFN